MDEREKKCFDKIYTELFTWILFGCAVSLVIKFAWFHMSVSGCIIEYLILVGSPVYMVIRTRMLGVTQAASFTRSKGRRMRTALLAALIVSVTVFAAIRRGDAGNTDWGELLIFGLAFSAAFIGGQLLFRHLEQRRQKKLDERYEE